ncbi:Cytochrome c3 family protein [Rubrivivax sp. A210]|uniref:cytochrome C n=1 Tax=Rubrivivax sp. A210 TaxID=2772301 RepID=UPI00191A9A07|nr:cytochrome C [Rubrivivax sp. A210]CAD5366366.1 Cytochrome c3 family protein [Rubrivivax sp. A210]
MRRLLAALALLWAGALPAQTIESVLAPGLVIQGHVKTEHDCKACHVRFERNAQDGLCLACHKDVGEDIRLHKGWHGRRDAKQQAQPCRACHTDHKGRAAQVAAFDQRQFDHRATDFELHDKHAGVECAKCHLPAKRWREAPLACNGCHAKDDVHKGGLGAKCEDCHDAKDWKKAIFDHAKTRFPLVDKHEAAKCEACHAQARYKDTPRTCIGCHRKEDEHKGRYGERCEACHGAKAWKPSSFNHDADTKYPLRDKHRAVKCSACHTGTLYVQKLGSACVDCHRKDDKHEGTLGNKCADCHGERSWKDPAKSFDHDKSRFPLLGAHIKTPCKDCHADPLYRNTPSDCIACHRKDDRHKGNLGPKCGDCHGEVNWKSVPGRFDHARTKFPLRNAHAAKAVACHDCHETLKDYKGTPTACVSCHRRDDRHEATLGTRCEQCHTDVNWKVARFDHGKTRFALAGGHAVVACRDCHKTLRYKEAPSDCLACHRKDDKHKATLGAACQNCHNVRAWTLWDFDHARTKFKLEGRHPKVACTACHAQPAPAGKPIAAVGSDCLACHRKDDRHEGRFGRRCEQCHSADSWRQLRKAGAAR